MYLTNDLANNLIDNIENLIMIRFDSLEKLQLSNV